VHEVEADGAGGLAAAGGELEPELGAFFAVGQELETGERQGAAGVASGDLPHSPQAHIIECLPGMGPILGVGFIVAAGDLAAFADAGRLACAAGLVPVPWDSGRHTGNLHRPKRYSRRLRRVFYLSAQTSIIHEGPNRDHNAKKRAEGCKHVPAVIALACRCVDVLWALLAMEGPSPRAHQSLAPLDWANALHHGDSLHTHPREAAQ
jgi:transposase